MDDEFQVYDIKTPQCNIGNVYGCLMELNEPIIGEEIDKVFLTEGDKDTDPASFWNFSGVPRCCNSSHEQEKRVLEGRILGWTTVARRRVE
jgi:hypothetical protein